MPSFRSAGPGVLVEDLSPPGKGEAIVPGRRVAVKYVLRRSNGYFVDASYGFDRFENFVWIVGSGTVIEGFERGLLGLRPGARRRMVVLPEVGYVSGGTRKDSPGPIPPQWGNRRALASHVNEPLVFEVLVVSVT